LNPKVFPRTKYIKKMLTRINFQTSQAVYYDVLGRVRATIVTVEKQ